MVTQMKIGEETATGYADASNFTFPNNPKLVDISMDTQRAIRELAHQRIHLMVDQGGLKPRTFVLSGFFFGTNKIADMNTFQNHIYEQGMKRFYYTNDRFFFCFGGGAKHTFQESRTNYLDYVATLITPLPFAYDDTLATETWSISDAVTTDMNSTNDDGVPGGEGAFKNDGVAPAHILEWTITRGATGGNISKVEISDATGLTGNKITWSSGGSDLTANQVLKIFLFKVVAESGIRIFKKLFYTVDGTRVGSRDFDGEEPPFITASTTDQTFSVKLTGNTTATKVKADWRDTFWL